MRLTGQHWKCIELSIYHDLVNAVADVRGGCHVSDDGKINIG